MVPADQPQGPVVRRPRVCLGQLQSTLCLAARHPCLMLSLPSVCPWPCVHIASDARPRLGTTDGQAVPPPPLSRGSHSHTVGIGATHEVP